MIFIRINYVETSLKVQKWTQRSESSEGYLNREYKNLTKLPWLPNGVDHNSRKGNG